MKSAQMKFRKSQLRTQGRCPGAQVEQGTCRPGFLITNGDLKIRGACGVVKIRESVDKRK